jgi:1,4-dihydroxy-2-naphthoyl-CoA hydrolase
MSDREREPLADLLGLMPYARTLGIRLHEAAAQLTRASLDWAPGLCTAGGVLHGGVIMALADSAAAVCAFLNLPAGASTTTIESKTNFLRALRGGTLHASTRPLHVGRSVIVLQTELSDDEGRAVAHTIQTQAVLAGG